MTTTRTHFTIRVDTWTSDGESIVEQRRSQAGHAQAVAGRARPTGRRAGSSWSRLRAPSARSASLF